MKILFLDFDGPLNIWPNPSRTGTFHKPACMNLEMLLNRVPGLKVVVSSSWRTFGLAAVKDILKSNGIDPRKVIDVTGDENSVDPNNRRGHQVECWLKRHPEVQQFAIVDDDAHFTTLKNKLVKTNRYIGLTQANVEKLIELLDG
jgi:HAD domain in Swiss Army Knife RNA repair proteins